MCTSTQGALYETVANIGQGGFGQVYQVRRCADGQELAAKVIEEEEWLPVGQAGDPETTISPMALRELAYLTQVTRASAPHVAPLLDFAFSLDDTQALVLIMPLYTGDLASAIKRRRLSVRERVDVAGDLLEALAFLHDFRPAIVHRDVKPENVLLDASDRGFLADFGLASFGSETPINPDTPREPPQDAPQKRRRQPRRSSSVSSTGCVGTETYIAPEAVKHGGLAHPSQDLWAAGVTLFELYQNRRLDAEDDATAIRRLRRWREDLVGEVPSLIRGLLADEPLRRTPAASVLSEMRRTLLRRNPHSNQVRAPDLRSGEASPPLEPSPEIASACKALKAKLPQTPLAAQRYRDAAPEAAPWLLAAVAYKLYEHRPAEDSKIMTIFGLDTSTAVDEFEDGQGALVARLGGRLLTVASPLLERTQLPQGIK